MTWDRTITDPAMWGAIFFGVALAAGLVLVALRDLPRPVRTLILMPAAAALLAQAYVAVMIMTIGYVP